MEREIYTLMRASCQSHFGGKTAPHAGKSRMSRLRSLPLLKRVISLTMLPSFFHQRAGAQKTLSPFAVNGIGGVILHADLAVDDGAFLHNQGRGAQLAEERPGSMDRHAAGSPCLPAEGAAQHKFAHIKSALDNGILAHDERAFLNDFAGKLPVDPHGPLKRQFAVIYRA